jgi:hypothetical protein
VGLPGDYKTVALSEEEARNFHRPRLKEADNFKCAIRLVQERAVNKKRQDAGMASDKPIKALTQLAPYEGTFDSKQTHGRQGMGMKAVGQASSWRPLTHSEALRDVKTHER